MALVHGARIGTTLFLAGFLLCCGKSKNGPNADPNGIKNLVTNVTLSLGGTSNSAGAFYFLPNDANTLTLVSSTDPNFCTNLSDSVYAPNSQIAYFVLATQNAALGVPTDSTSVQYVSDTSTDLGANTFFTNIFYVDNSCAKTLPESTSSLAATNESISGNITITGQNSNVLQGNISLQLNRTGDSFQGVFSATTCSGTVLNGASGGLFFPGCGELANATVKQHPLTTFAYSYDATNPAYLTLFASSDQNVCTLASQNTVASVEVMSARLYNSANSFVTTTAADYPIDPASSTVQNSIYIAVVDSTCGYVQPSYAPWLGSGNAKVEITSFSGPGAALKGSLIFDGLTQTFSATACTTANGLSGLLSCSP